MYSDAFTLNEFYLKEKKKNTHYEISVVRAFLEDQSNSALEKLSR